MGNCLRQLDPGFDPRSYGYKQLSQLIKVHLKIFEFEFTDENEIVGKALFFNISALRSKLDMAQHNDSVGIIILTVSI